MNKLTKKSILLYVLIIAVIALIQSYTLGLGMTGAMASYDEPFFTIPDPNTTTTFFDNITLDDFTVVSPDNTEGDGFSEPTTNESETTDSGVTEPDIKPDSDEFVFNYINQNVDIIAPVIVHSGSVGEKVSNMNAFWDGVVVEYNQIKDEYYVSEIYKAGFTSDNNAIKALEAETDKGFVILCWKGDSNTTEEQQKAYNIISKAEIGDIVKISMDPLTVASGYNSSGYGTVSFEKPQNYSGKYYVKITWDCVDQGDDYGNAYPGIKNARDQNCVGFSLFYRDKNGTGTEYERTFDLQSKMSSAGTYTETAAINGFPTSLYVHNDHGALIDRGIINVKKIEVSGSSEGSYKTLWEGTMYLDSTNQIKYAHLYSDYTFDNLIDTNCIVVETDYGNWEYPYAKDIRWFDTPESVSLQMTSEGSASQNVSVIADDQYGVRMYDPTWSAYGNKTSDGITFDKETGTDNTVNVATEAFVGIGASQSVTLKAAWGETCSEKSFPLFSSVSEATPSYKVALDFEVINTCEGGGNINIYYYGFKDDGSGIDTSTSYCMQYIQSLKDYEPGAYQQEINLPGWPYKIEASVTNSSYFNESELIINDLVINGRSISLPGFTIDPTGTDTETVNIEVDPYTGELLGSYAGIKTDWIAPHIYIIYSNDYIYPVGPKFGEAGKTVEVSFTAIDQYNAVWPIMPKGSYSICDVDGNSAMFNENNIICTNTSSVGCAATTVTILPDFQLLNPGTTATDFCIRAVFNGVEGLWRVIVMKPEYTVSFDSNGGNSIDSQNIVYGGKIAIPSVTKDNRTLVGFIRDGKLNDSISLKEPSPINTDYTWLKSSTKVDETGDSTWYAVWTTNDADITFLSADGLTIGKLKGRVGNSMINSTPNAEAYLNIESLNKNIKNKCKNENIAFNSESEPVYFGDGAIYRFNGWKLISMIDESGNSVESEIDKDIHDVVLTGNAVFQAVYSIADYDSGYCGAEDSGKNLQWNLDVVNGILTISGTGDMRDYFISSLAPWHGYRNYIKTIIIEDGVTSIGDFAFYECRKVVTFTITDDITRIGKYAFNGCDLIVSMYIPSSVNTIDAKAFHSCNGLVEFIVNGDNQYFTSVDGVLFDKNVEELIKFPLAKEVTEYFAPDSIKSIGADSFNGCMYLTKISFYADTIKENAFYGCENLENVTIGGRVRNIEPYAFYNCKNLKELSIYSINLTIGDWAFYKCNNLETIEYKGSQAMWDEFDFGNDNKPLTKANVITGIYTSAVEPSNSVITFRKRVAPPTANEECKHNYETVVTAPTCSSKGFTTYTCSKCGNSYNGDETEALVHSYNAVITKATCNEGGFTTYTCSVCGDCYVADNTEAIGYCDENSDGKCDNCEFDFADDCNCSCHSNGIKKLLYKLIRFFWRAFRVNNTCRCGVAHY